jgi:transmembrane sensor
MTMPIPPEKSTSPHLDDEAIRWATRLDGGELAPAELAAFDAWLARDATCPWRLAHYQQFFAQLHGTLPAMAAAGAIEMDDLPAERRRQPWWRFGLGAAVAAVAIFAAVLWGARPRNFSTALAQRQSVTLADGTRAELNARTQLSVDLRRSSRRVRLERGEVLFHVTKDPARPFVVETGAGAVRVLGTVFDVRSAPSGTLVVTVLEGRVLVQPVDAAGREVPAPPVLLAGDRMHFDPATGALRLDRPAAVDDAVAWREGRAVFTGTPLGEALERFADYHDRSIAVAPEAAALLLGGRYTLDDLDLFVASLEQALPVRVLPTGTGGLRVVARTP